MQNRDVFAIVNNSSFAFLSYRYMLEQGVPMIGGGFDGTYYTQKGNEDIISALGSGGTSDVGPLVPGIKNSGADAVYLPIVAASKIAVVEGLQQNGVEMKANVLATGYGQEFLDSPVAKTLKPNTVSFQTYKPVELKDKATKQFQADRKKYAGLTGVPDYRQYTRYITRELAILGLWNAGKTPTRRGFIDGLRKLGTYDEAGLACTRVDISVEGISKAPTTGCSYYMYVKDGRFVVMNKDKPYTGKLGGSKEALAATAAGDLSSVTTTAAPAS